MTDSGLKKTLGYILRNKEQISELLNRFQAEDVEKGILALPENLINRDLKMFIMEKGDPYLDDYLISFNNDAIFLDATVIMKQLGKVNAKYMLRIENFTFNNLVRKISLTYQEDVKSQGNMVQSMALKAAGLKGPYLETAISMSNLPFITVDNHQINIDLYKIEAMKKIPSELVLNYLSSVDGCLKFKFSID